MRVGVSPDAPPLVFKQGDAIVGLEADLARELGTYLGKSVVFVEVKWEDQITALLENRTDIIMAGMSITQGRQYRMAFSHPYLRTGQIALVRKGDEKRVPIAGFYGIFAWAPVVRIGVVKGTTGELFAKRNFNDAKKIISFETAQDAVDALTRGSIEGFGVDLLIYDAPMVFYLASENEGRLVPLPALLTEEYLAWGIRRNDEALLESANTFIQTMNKSGKLKPIIKRWIPFL